MQDPSASALRNDLYADQLGIPRYKCHKVVRAAKIVASEQQQSEPNVFMLLLELPDATTVSWRYQPPGRQANAESFTGGYLVVYDDGYTSWSPAKAFEEGYSLDEPNALELGAAARAAEGR